MIDLIYTSGDNALLTQITLDESWLVGMRSDKHAYVPISFVDVQYKQPNFERHLAMVREMQPKYAVVPDLGDTYVDRSDVLRALHQADDLLAVSPHTIVLIVPKLSGQLPLIPSDFSIGYSLPSNNGAAQYGLWKLEGRRIHLLGGNPHYQIKLYRLYRHSVQIRSADGNMAQKVALKFTKYWENGAWIKHPKATQEKEKQVVDLPYECIRWSLRNIRQAWIQQDTPMQTLWNEVA